MLIYNLNTVERATLAKIFIHFQIKVACLLCRLLGCVLLNALTTDLYDIYFYKVMALSKTPFFHFLPGQSNPTGWGYFDHILFFYSQTK